mmetsp:Transcript_16983/g.39291  ORF Transcript_16983/g.39291 Transcript_16983/m.39291 type:complete len:308 (+) Transcript_16983:288-1211(+)
MRDRTRASPAGTDRWIGPARHHTLLRGSPAGAIRAESKPGLLGEDVVLEGVAGEGGDARGSVLRDLLEGGTPKSNEVRSLTLGSRVAHLASRLDSANHHGVAAHPELAGGGARGLGLGLGGLGDGGEGGGNGRGGPSGAVAAAGGAVARVVVLCGPAVVSGEFVAVRVKRRSALELEHRGVGVGQALRVRVRRGRGAVGVDDGPLAAGGVAASVVVSHGEAVAARVDVARGIGVVAAGKGQALSRSVGTGRRRATAADGEATAAVVAGVGIAHGEAVVTGEGVAGGVGVATLKHGMVEEGKVKHRAG